MNYDGTCFRGAKTELKEELQYTHRRVGRTYDISVSTLSAQYDGLDSQGRCIVYNSEIVTCWSTLNCHYDCNFYSRISESFTFEMTNKMLTGMEQLFKKYEDRMFTKTKTKANIRDIIGKQLTAMQDRSKTSKLL